MDDNNKNNPIFITISHSSYSCKNEKKEKKKKDGKIISSIFRILKLNATFKFTRRSTNWNIWMLQTIDRVTMIVTFDKPFEATINVKMLLITRERGKK